MLKLFGLLGGEDQARLDAFIAELRTCTRKHVNPATHHACLIGVLADANEACAAVHLEAPSFGPRPSRCRRSQEIQCCLGDQAFAPRVQKVVNGAEPVGRHPEAQEGGIATVSPGLSSVGKNFSLGGDEMLEFLDFFLQESGLGKPRRQGELDVAPAWSAI